MTNPIRFGALTLPKSPWQEASYSSLPTLFCTAEKSWVGA